MSAVVKAQDEPKTEPALFQADDLLKLSESGQRYELIRGELEEMSPAGTRHGRIAMRAGSLIEQYVRENNLGAVYAAETGFKLHEDPDTVRAADVAFVTQARIPAEGEPEGFWAIAPDLVVEVVSPFDRATMIQTKVHDWLEAGCRLVWVIYPDSQSVVEYHSFGEVRVLRSQDNLSGGEILVGFTCLVQELFT